MGLLQKSSFIALLLTCSVWVMGCSRGGGGDPGAQPPPQIEVDEVELDSNGCVKIFLRKILVTTNEDGDTVVTPGFVGLDNVEIDCTNIHWVVIIFNDVDGDGFPTNWDGEIVAGSTSEGDEGRFRLPPETPPVSDGFVWKDNTKIWVCIVHDDLGGTTQKRFGVKEVPLKLKPPPQSQP